MSFDDCFKITQGFFPADGKSAAPEATWVEFTIAELKGKASSDDQDAIEFLLNLSAGHPTSEVSQAAQRALLDVYSAPDTTSEVREAIGAQAIKLFEAQKGVQQAVQKALGSRSRHGVGAGAPLQPVIQMSTPLMYLAGQNAHEHHYHETRKEILSAIRSRGQWGALGDAIRQEDLLCRGRFTTTEEMLAATQSLKALQSLGTCLDLNPPLGANSFSHQLGMMHVSAVAHRKPTSAYVNVGNHWVVLVLMPQRLPSERVDALILDSLLGDSGGDRSAALQDAVKKYLRPNGGTVERIGAAMQQNAPNACGPLALKAVTQIDAYLVDSPSSSFQGLVAAMKENISDWMDMPAEAQKAHVIAQRALMMECIAKSSRA